jgi:hypothetical protein
MWVHVHIYVLENVHGGRPKSDLPYENNHIPLHHKPPVQENRTHYIFFPLAKIHFIPYFPQQIGVNRGVSKRQQQYQSITRRRNPIGFLPEVWSPLQATVHLCGIFYLPWYRHSDTRDHGFHSLYSQLVFFCMYPGRNRTRSQLRTVF